MPTPYVPRRQPFDTVIFESVIALLALVLIMSGFTLYVTRGGLDEMKTDQLASAHVHVLHTPPDDTVL